MTVELDLPADEIKGLQRCINDLVALLGLPASWVGREPSHIARTLLDALDGMLDLDLVYLRLIHPTTDAPIEMARVAPGPLPTSTDALREMLDSWLEGNPRRWPPALRRRLGPVELSLVPVPVGMEGELGVLIAGSGRADFPSQIERLLLTVAKNQAVIALQGARLLGKQERLAQALDERVTQRTTELAAANEALTTEVAERRLVEAALRDSERDSRLIVDSIPGLVATFTPDGQLEFVNQQIVEYFGRSLEDLRRWGTDGTTHPDDSERVVEAFIRAIASGQPFEVESRARRFDGVYRWLQSRGFPLRDADGHIVRWYNLLTDIDERRRAEEALAASEGNLKLITDTIPALAWSALADGRADFFNQHFLEFVGLSADQAANWGWMAAVHPDDVNGLTAAWQRILASEAPGEAEARLRRVDGSYRWFLLRANPLRDDTGRIVKWYGTNTDIHDRRMAEEELRRSEAFLLEAQRLSLTGSFSWRVATDEITWSDQMYRIFDLDPAESVTFARLMTRIHPEDMATFIEVVSRAQQDGADFEYEKRLLMPDGSVRYLHIVAHSTRHPGIGLEYIGAVQDVTERRHAQEELDRVRSDLTHVARVTSLGTLAASIAHEVNQPLSGIVTNASTCLRMLATEPPNLDGARETARRTIRDGHRASEVVNRLRGLFTRKEVVTESVDLNAATREVIALTASELRRSAVIVREELTDGLPAVTGDRVQLQQVILNLLLNAADAMSWIDDRPRELVVRTWRDEGDGVCLSVQDSGVGFPLEDRERLFEAFYTTKAEGMGIGLSVSRSVIERHHGRLWAVANAGPGATFSFSLPAESDTKV